jgi:LuxR family maltose regulon positive regulatory protein
MQAAEEFETRLNQVSRPREFDEDLCTLKVRLQIAGGDINSASQWADQVQLSEDFRLNKEYYRLTLARIFLAQGKYDDMEEILNGVLSETSANNRLAKQIKSKLLKAAGYSKLNRLPDAMQIFEYCLALAGPEGYIRTFLNVGEPVRELLVTYLRLKEPAHKPYAQKLLAAFSYHETDSSSIKTGGLIEPLSSRELEVLQLIAAGRTNQEIAKQLVVAAGTIKAHAASIYRKLDAANRTEAVAHARRLGILT